MAKRRPNFEMVCKHLCNRIHTTGEEVKLDFPNILRVAIEHEAWRAFHKTDGTPFESLVDWLHYSFPNGCDMGRGRFSLTYEDAMQLCDTDSHRDVYQVLCEHAPRRKKGQPKKGDASNAPRGALVPSGHEHSNRRNTLAVRLAKEHPKFFKQYLEGHYKSIRAAAEAAGLVQPGHDPLKRMKSYWNKATAKQRREFLDWCKASNRSRVASRNIK